MLKLRWMIVAFAAVAGIASAHPLLDLVDRGKQGAGKSTVSWSKVDKTSVKELKRFRDEIVRNNRHIKWSGYEKPGEQKEEGYEEAPGVDYLNSLIRNIERRAFPGDRINVEAIDRAVQEREQSVGPLSIPPDARWRFLGPNGLDIPYRIYYGVPPLNGRVNGLAIDPVNPNTFWLASAGGGVWKTTNAGGTWTALTDGWQYLLTSSVAIHPTQPNTVYVGTGDFPGSWPYGMGIMKTTDGGTTWTNQGRAQFGNTAVSSIAIDPETPDRVIISTGRGNGGGGRIWISQNGGSTWTSAAGLPVLDWCQVKFGAANTTTGVRALYAAGSGTGNLWRSLDRGATWTQLPVPSNGSQSTTDVAASLVDPNTVYFMANQANRIYRSTDQGATWSDITAGFPGGYNWSQAWYNWHLTISRNGNTDILYCGQITLSRWDAGSGQWTDIGITYQNNAATHNDQHAMAIDPSNPARTIVGNDGGVFLYNFTTNAFTPINGGGLGITQFYRMDVHPTDPNILLGGTQDNATPSAEGNLAAWSNRWAGDGAGCAINPVNPAIRYHSSQRNSLYRTLNAWAGGAFTNISPTWGSDRLPFIGQLALDPNNPSLMYAGSNFLWRWNEDTDTWTPRLGNQALTNGTIEAIAIAPGDGNRIYTGGTDGQVWMTTNGGTTWTQINVATTGGTNLPQRAVTSISIHPTNKDDILVALSGTGAAKVWRLANASGATRSWVDVDGSGSTGVPNIPANAIVRDPADPANDWYVGTDIGVFQTKDGGNNWEDMTLAYGLPNVIVNELRIGPGTTNLTAATFGRGIWRIDLRPLSVQSLALNPTTVSAGQSSVGTVTMNRAAGTPITVSLSSGNPAVATVPNTVTIGQGATSATFNVTTASVAQSTNVTITASFDGSSQAATLTVRPFSLTGFTISAGTYDGGNPITGTLTLGGPAPVGGLQVQITSNRPTSEVTPTNVTIPAGQTTANFSVGTFPVLANTLVTLTATSPAGTRTANTQLLPILVTTIGVSPSSAVGGNPATGTVTLQRAAPATGIRVGLSSSATGVATVPTSVLVPAGSSSATFPVSSTPRSSTSGTTLRANWIAVPEVAFTVIPPSLTGFSGVTALTEGRVGRATVSLNGPAYSGAVVTFRSNNPRIVSIPTSATFGAGARSLNVAVTAGAVTAPTAVTITATFRGVSRSYRITVNPLGLSTLGINPSTVAGGTAAVGTVTLAGPAPAGGKVVALTSSNGTIAAVPTSVTVAAGRSSATFTVRTTRPAVNTRVTITARMNGQTVTAPLSVTR